jgi:transposase InsO family protein
VLLRFPTYGYRRVAAQLRREGCLINHKRVRRVMGENDLLAIVKKRVKTTNSKHSYGRYPNLVKDLVIVRPDQVWCADITYIQLQRVFIYLAIILDVFTRSLRGWHLGRSLSTDLPLTALKRALIQRTPEIHHSDQGVQYAAEGYVEQLETAGVQISMTARGQAIDNPYAERVIRTIKEEEVYLADYVDFADAYQHIGHFIQDVYQTKRIHSALGYLTPMEFEAAYWAGLEPAQPVAADGLLRQGARLEHLYLES